MVAYSFQTRFAPDIQSAQKTHTIRGQRKRHARQGEMLQLYCKMRHPECFKIITDPVCTFVDPISITYHDKAIVMIWTGPDMQDEILPDDFDLFARLDGFTSARDMHRFWLAQDAPLVHGTAMRQFDGFIIGWGQHPLEILYPS
ncbi:MAG: hypothetical protein AAF230_00095 [Pseudomonadota bacterium]